MDKNMEVAEEQVAHLCPESGRIYFKKRRY